MNCAPFCAGRAAFKCGAIKNKFNNWRHFASRNSAQPAHGGFAQIPFPMELRHADQGEYIKVKK